MHLKAFIQLCADNHFRLFAGGLALRLAGMPLSFLVTVWITRQLGVSEFGTYSFAMSIASLLSTPFVGGLATYLLREQSKAHHDEDWLRIKSLSASSSAAILGWSLLVGFFGSVFVLSSGMQHASLWLMTFILIPLLGQNSVRTQALRAINLPMLSMTLDQVANPAIKLAVFVVVYFIGLRLSSDYAMGVQVLAAFGLFMVGSYYLIKQFRMHSVGKLYVRPFAVLRSARPLMMLTVVQVVAAQMAVQILNYLSNPAQVGAYKAADQLAVYVAFGLPLVNTLFAPQMAKAIKIADRKYLQSLATKNVVLALVISVPAALVLMIMPGVITDVLYGHSFSEQGTQKIVPVLAAAYLVNTLGGSNGVMMSMSGHERLSTITVILCMALVIVCGVLWVIPNFGAFGMAWLMLGYYTVLNVILSFMVKKYVGVNSTPFLYKR